MAVHAYGRPQLIEEPSALADLVERMTATFERNMPAPWIFDSADPFIQKLAGGIIGFRIEVERIEGKWKLNQNHPVERRRKVIAALRERGGEDDSEMALLMEQTLRE